MAAELAGDAVTIFFSYSHKDEALRDELAKHLTILERLGIIESWHDRRILAGDKWDGEISEKLNTARIILLLISADFLASKYIWEKEVKRAMERHDAGDAIVIPIVLRAVDWKGALFRKLQALPTNAQAITSLPNRDEAFTEVALGIRAKVEQLRNVRQNSPPSSQPALSSALEEYREEAAQILAEEGGQIDAQGRIILDGLRDRFSLPPQAVSQIEQELLSPYFAYEQTFERFVELDYPLNPKARNRLQRQQQRDGLSDSAIAQIEKRVLGGDDLSTEKGIDYRQLQKLLKAQAWKAADQETYKVMIRAVGKQSGDGFTKNELLNFPCQDLLTIDRLWVKYSQGQFGFSVQKQIYVECGGKLDGEYPGDKIWRQFGDKVGWRENDSWIRYSEE